jgi:DNA-binding SARP family transcriptional activator/Flp pilus assembly protein TadD
MDTEFLLLGSLAVRVDGSAVRVPPGNQCALLAALLLRANHVVTVDDLAEMLWGEDLPSSARTGVQNYVMMLRRALGAAGSRISTQPRGYLIRVNSGELDLDRFEDLLRDARAAAQQARWTDAAEKAGAALGLWRDEPLADVGSDLLTARERPRLAELRLQAAETRIDADLHLGRHAEVISELRQLAAEQPLREQLHGLLMLALYRDGRQAGALAAYQQARDVLVDQLGVEPGPDLQQLHKQILTADPALRADASVSASKPARPAPQELPGDVAAFTGRTGELAELDQMLLSQPDQDGEAKVTAAVISAVSGTAGVGKTALAIHWAHHAAEKFPDGQLYVNLRGYDPAQPVTAADVLAMFLRSLGVAGRDIPQDESERAARYRSLLAGRQVLVVLDNASTVGQVRPLLPGHPACAVVVTSRDSLAGLVARDGARRLNLDLLPLADAVALLRQLVGARVDAEPGAAVTLAAQCARLPLALRVAAELATARPHVPLASLVTELSGQRQRLDLLHADGDPATSVRTVFSWSYHQLSAEAARMFRLLGLHPGPDISVPAAASLAGIPEAEARQLLAELARAHLIAEHAPGRYAFHDLLRAYAADQAYDTDNDTARREATGRMLDHYLHTAARATLLLLDPPKEPVVLAPPRPGAAPEQPTDYSQALAWFEAEHHVLLAAISLGAGSGFDAHAWQLPWAMVSFLRIRGHWQERAAIQRTALAAATRLDDTAAQAVSSRLLAATWTELGDYEQARCHYARSLTLYQRLGNRLGEARIQHGLGVVSGRQGHYADALDHAEQAMSLYQASGDKASEAEALNNVGWYHGLLGDYEKARALCRQALTLCAEAGNRWFEGEIWDSLGYAEHQLGNLAEAVACYQRALILHREASYRSKEAKVLTHLGDTRHAAGEPAQARQAWQQALAIFDDLQHPDADQVRAKLASPTHRASRNPSA